MSLDVYRSINGLGTRCTGQRVVSYAPFVEYDDTQGIRVDSVPQTSAYVKIKITYDAVTESATVTVTYASGSENTFPSVALPINTQTNITADSVPLLVTRISTCSTGTMSIRPVVVANNDIGMSDQTDPSGVTTYRCVFLHNNSSASQTLTQLLCSPEYEVAFDAAGETTQTISDEYTPPSGLSFIGQSVFGSPIAIAADQTIPLWVKRTVLEEAGEHWSYVAIVGSVAGCGLYGSYVTSLTSIPPYYAYSVFDPVGGGATTIDNSDDIAAPVEITSLPYTVDMGAIQDAAHGAGINDFVMRIGVRAVTTAGAQSQNQLLDYALHLNYASGDVTRPNAPTIDTVEYLDGGQVRVVVDHDQAGGVTRAIKLTATIGAESITKLLSSYEDTTETEFIFQTPVVWGSSVTVSVVAVDALNRASAADTDTGTAYYEYGESSGWNLAPASLTGAIPDYAEFVSTESFGDVSIITAAGMTSISLNGTSVITAQTAPHASTRLHTLALTGGTISAGACSDPIEPVSTTVCYLCAGGSRVAKVDLSAGTLTCPVFNDTAVLDCPLEGPYQEIGNYTYWQYFDVSVNRWKPFMIVDKTNTAIHFIKNLECV